MEAVHYQDAAEIAAALRRGEVSPVELTRTMIERIERLNPSLNAFVIVMADQAMDQAHRAAAAFEQGRDLGPLHGIPIAVKDNIWTRGIVTTNGMKIRADHRPDEDSTIIERLDAAGAILLGKLQQTEGAFIEHHPSVTVPVNPWDRKAWCGVSSSGSGVATAAGLCFAALGTDTGGSIRVPCDVNGVTGIKPTYGRVTRHGVFENGPSLDHVGVFARSARDVAAMLEVIAGPDERDATSADLPVPPYGQQITDGIAGVRIGLDRSFAFENVAPEIVEALTSALAVLETAGARIVDLRFPGDPALISDWMLQSAVEMAASHEEYYPTCKAEYGPVLADYIEFGRSRSAIAYHRAQMARDAFRGRLARMFQDVDLLAVPTQSMASPSTDMIAAMASDPHALEKLARFTCLFNMSGSPTLILSMGKAPNGVPISFQLVGRHFEESLLLRAGHAFQQRTEWHHRHPPL